MHASWSLVDELQLTGRRHSFEPAIKTLSSIFEKKLIDCCNLVGSLQDVLWNRPPVQRKVLGEELLKLS